MKIVRSKLWMFPSSTRILPLPNGTIPLSKVYARKMYGAREANLEYMIHKEVAVVMPHPGLLADHPHSEAAKSIQGEQANRLSHTHPLYQRNNDQLYSTLEAATRGTTYEATIKPFRIAHSGRGGIFGSDFSACRERQVGYFVKDFQGLRQ